MTAMTAANTADLLTAANDKTFRNLIYWAEIKCGPMIRNLIYKDVDFDSWK
jgi:hypothetical protein